MSRFTGKLQKQDEPTPIFDAVRRKVRETPIHDQVKCKVKAKKEEKK